MADDGSVKMNVTAAALMQQTTIGSTMESSLLPVVKPRGRSRARKQNSSRISRVFQRAFEVQLRGLKGKSLIRNFREEEDDGHQEVVVEMAVEEEEPELSSLSLGQQARPSLAPWRRSRSRHLRRYPRRDASRARPLELPPTTYFLLHLVHA